MKTVALTTECLCSQVFLDGVGVLALYPIGISDVFAAINVSLAFCMGSDIAALAESDQPMADIFLRSFGAKGTLAVWAFVVIVQ